MKDDPTGGISPPEAAQTPSIASDEVTVTASVSCATSAGSTATRGSTMPESLGFSEEDWLIIDEALHRVARSLRKIEREEQLKQLQEAEGHLPAHQ